MCKYNQFFVFRLSRQRPKRSEPLGRGRAASVRSSRIAYIPAAVPVRIFSSIPSLVKFTWHGQTLYRCLWGTIPFPVETNCPHLERQPPFYTIVGHIPVPGEFHEGRLAPAQPLNPSQHTLTAPSRGQAFACKSLSTPIAARLPPFRGTPPALHSGGWLHCCDFQRKSC